VIRDTHQHGINLQRFTVFAGAVTLIQCFGGTLNLNIHYHMLFLDGVYIEDKYGVLGFRRVKAPTIDELIKLTHAIARRG